MTNKNPKKHDSLFKWLIASFTTEFFAHYFPNIEIGDYQFIDKEFISKYEALKESLKDDLFLIIEMVIDGILHEVVIQIEHKSKREDVTERMYEYSCYAWLLKRRPVWSIIIYSDDAKWRKPIPDNFWFAFSSRAKKQYCQFDIIKVKDEKSVDLIKDQSMICKLLALKADDRNTDYEQLIREIYQTVAKDDERLTNDQKLLIEQWVQGYKKVSNESVEKKKKEVEMSFVATTISEHISHEGELKSARKMIVQAISTKFHSISKDTMESVNKIKDLNILESILDQVILTANFQELKSKMDSMLR